jgi:hypothetical protein
LLALSCSHCVLKILASINIVDLYVLVKKI